MPRSRNHGGPRQGAPGVAYANRTDLNADRSAPASAMPVTPAAPQAQAAAPQPSVVTPDMTPAPSDPTLYPEQPVTAGLQTGMPGPNSLRDAAYAQAGTDALRGVYAATGDLRVLSIIEFNESFR